MSARLTFDAELWASESVAAWVFVTVPADVSEAIRDESAALEPKGFGSVRVEARVGTTTWRTSVFPDAGTGCYVLPVKKAVRAAERLDVGDPTAVSLLVLDEH
jgi:hypothetical protein